jgi:hypothetical protein
MNFQHPVTPLAWSTITLVAAVACGGPVTEQTGDWVVERDTIGDTVVVRTLSGSVWDAPMELRVDLSIGVLDGDPTLMFGKVLEMAVDAEGGIYAFDYMVPALRFFDADGNYVRTLGRDGAGPGEYRSTVHGVAVRSDGRVVMGDFSNRRINVFNPDGTPSADWPIESNMFANNSLVLDHRDHVFLKVLWQGGDPRSTIGFQHYDASGSVIDTLAPPVISGEPTDAEATFAPMKVWTLSPQAVIIVGVSDRYAIELRRLDGTVTRIERLATPVSVKPEERAELEALANWARRRRGRTLTLRGGTTLKSAGGSNDVPAISTTKPFYRALLGGEQGRIWVHRHVTAEKVDVVTEPDPSLPPPRTWQEPTVYDVFEADGTYLGEVHIPSNMSPEVFRGDTVWGTQRGEFDEQYLVRAVIAERTL